MIINARFVSSASNISNALLPALSEVAFLGRSNVGKSSLINALCNHKGLAKSSSTPGKTRLINFFEVTYKQDEEKIKLMFVDLPGFGYARVSKSLKDQWNKDLDEFLRQRQNIKLFIHLRDSRHFDLANDEQIIKYLESIKSQSAQVLEVFTKADKLNQSAKAKLANAHPNALLVSKSNASALSKLANTILRKTLGYK